MRQLFQRTLRENIERTDRFNLVAVKFNTNRVRVQKAVHIDNAPSNRKLAYPAHHRLFRKTMIEEPRAQRRRFQLVAHLERTHLTHDFARFREFHQEGIQRTHHNKRLIRTRNITEKLEAFFEHALKRYLDFVRLQAERRKEPDKRLAHHAFQVFDPDFGAAVILSHNENILRAFQEPVRHHHRSQRNRNPVYMDSLIVRIFKKRNRRERIFLKEFRNSKHRGKCRNLPKVQTDT